MSRWGYCAARSDRLLPRPARVCQPFVGGAMTARGDGVIGMVAVVAMGQDDGDDEAVASPRRGSRRLPRTVRIGTADGTVVCTRCEVVERTIPRMRGLLGRDDLGPGEGMLIDPAPSVMTFFMRFPIDVVFTDRAQKIVKIAHSLAPWRATGARGAVAALELPAGTAAALDLEPGMALVFAEPLRALRHQVQATFGN
jgi:uncharacterized membrane protein (UPF0127 family)